MNDGSEEIESSWFPSFSSFPVVAVVHVFMFIRVVVRIIAFLLIAESMFGALRLSVLLAQFGIYDALAIALILARGALGVLQFTGGWLLAHHRPAGVVFARWALAGGAVLTIFDVGLQLAPTNIYYWYRWQVTGAYAVYALAAIWWLSFPRAGTAADASTS